ncbi:unnamed protein product [Chironomus riparius]|uniref:Uncharacterized protein n=1 Tax=Chironomus riparius TaxID=315576 RepID=A0A9N9S7K3_9DIPT|nr:unnamed protein product [Chironomus riparius]
MDFIKTKLTARRNYNKFDSSGEEKVKRKFIDGFREASRASISQVIDNQIFDSHSHENSNNHWQNQSTFGDRKRKLADKNPKNQRKIVKFNENSQIVKTSPNSILNDYKPNCVTKNLNYSEFEVTKSTKKVPKIPNFDEIENIFDEPSQQFLEKVPKNKFLRIKKNPKYLKSLQNSKTIKTKTISTSSHENIENLQFSDTFKALNTESTSTVTSLRLPREVVLKSADISLKNSIRLKLKSVGKIIKALKPSKSYQVQQIEDTTMRVKKLSDMPKYRRIRSQSVDGRIEEELTADLREILQESALRTSKSSENFYDIVDYEAVDFENVYEDVGSKNDNYNLKIEAFNPQKFIMENLDQTQDLVDHNLSFMVSSNASTPKRGQVKENVTSNHQNKLRTFHTSPYVSKFARSVHKYSQNKSFIDMTFLNDETSMYIQESELNGYRDTSEKFKPSISGRKSYKSSNEFRNIASYTEITYDIVKMNRSIEKSLQDVEQGLSYVSADSQAFSIKNQSLTPRSLNFTNIQSSLDILAVNPSRLTSHPSRFAPKMTSFEASCPKTEPATLSSHTNPPDVVKMINFEVKQQKDLKTEQTNQKSLENSTIDSLRREIEDLKLQIHLKDLKIDQLEKCEKLKNKQIEKITKIAEKKFSEVQKRENLLKIIKIQAEVSNNVAKIKTELSMKSLEVEKLKENLTKKNEKFAKIGKKLKSKNSELESQQLKIEELQKTSNLRSKELAVMAKCWEESHEFACTLYEAKRDEWKQKLLDLKKVINNLELKVDKEEPKLLKTLKKRTFSTSAKPKDVNEVTKKFIHKNFEAEMVPRLIKRLDSINLADNEDNIGTKRSKMSTDLGNVSF